MARLTLSGVAKSFGKVPVIHGVDLTIDDGEFVVFVGPSGCGKSTLLRMVAGLEEITAGEVAIDGERMNELPAAELRVHDHRHAGVDRGIIDERVRMAAAILGLEPLLKRRPKQLSGGQRQRVAIGRAIVRDPKIFLFDEPLSNLDAALRVQMRVEILRLHQRLRSTMIYVTHDQVEAMTLADRIVVLQAGRIEQIGTPMELYHHPTNLFVAEFIGSPKMNVLPASVVRSDGDAAEVRLAAGVSVVVPVARSVAPGTELRFGVRPEHLGLGAPKSGVLNGKVQVVERLGGETLIHIDLGDGVTLVAKSDGEYRAAVGDMVSVEPLPMHCHLFDLDGPTLDKPQRHELADAV